MPATTPEPRAAPAANRLTSRLPALVFPVFRRFLTAAIVTLAAVMIAAVAVPELRRIGAGAGVGAGVGAAAGTGAMVVAGAAVAEAAHAPSTVEAMRAD